MSRLQQVFDTDSQPILNVYYTAGYPNLQSTIPIAQTLAKSGVDILEIGMPYSDPLADGPTIQHSSEQALKNGMNMDTLFEQLIEIRKTITTPIILMGYLNQLMQYGEKQFVDQCQSTGVDGLIIPDMPLDIYEDDYKKILEGAGLTISFLVTPQTPADRMTRIDELSTGFVYVVADNSITGAQKEGFSQQQLAYFSRIRDHQFNSPTLIGFGISEKEQMMQAVEYAHGVIIGSAFIRQLAIDDSPERVRDFVGDFR